MDYARESSTRTAARRPAAEPDSGRAPAAERTDLRRAPIAQRMTPEDELQSGAPAQRAAQEELQMKAAPAPRAEAVSAPAGTSGLPAGLKAGIERLSGVSLDGVGVHYNSAQPAQLNALAYAQGREIHLGPGQEAHLPHEAWHVAQQAQGRVQPTTQLKDGVAINEDAGLEHEADVMGEKALGLGA